jgi:uncharacterized membrane protein YesL
MTTSQRIFTRTVPIVVFVIGAFIGMWLLRALLLLLLDYLFSVIPHEQTATDAQRLLFFAGAWVFWAVVIVIPCWASWRCSRRVQQILVSRYAAS